MVKYHSNDPWQWWLRAVGLLLSHFQRFWVVATSKFHPEVTYTIPLFGTHFSIFGIVGGYIWNLPIFTDQISTVGGHF